MNEVRDTMLIRTDGLTPPNEEYFEIKAVLKASTQVRTPLENVSDKGFKEFLPGELVDARYTKEKKRKGKPSQLTSLILS